MSDKISVVICGDYMLELQSVLSQEGFEDITAIHAPDNQNDPTRCGHSDEFIKNLLEKNKTTHIIGGSCLSMTNKTFRELGGTDLHSVSQCHYFLASEAIVDELQNQGAYLASPGWLKSWKKKLDFWGFDQQTAREFFRETTSKIVLLDTGVIENSRQHLKEFADYLDLPFETLYVGLDYLKMYLKMVMHNLKYKSDDEKKEINQPNDQIATYAMALEMVRQMSESKSAGETVQKTIEIFSMLFSPNNIIFHAKTEILLSRPKWFQFEGVTSLTENKQGFFLKIDIEGEIYGVLEIVNVAHPEYLDEYINLTLNLIGVVSLALKEAIFKEKLLETTEKLDWELTVNAALSEISRAMINQDYDLEYLAQFILEQAQELTGSKHCFISIVDEKTGDNIGHTISDVVGSSCMIEGEDRKIVFSMNDDGTYNGLWGHSLNIRTGFFTNDAAHHREARGMPQGHMVIEKFLSVPAIASGKLVGQIALANPENDYSERDLQVVTRLAHLYSLAIERKRVEDMISRMAAIVESSDDAIIGKTLEGTIISWNSGAEKLYGYSEEEAIGQSILLLVPDYKSGEVEGILKQIKKGEPVERFETERIRKDGEKIDVSLNISPVKNNKGEISGASSIAMNISDRKKAEKALIEAELTRDLALGAAGVGVFDWNIKNDVLVWDDTLYNLFGVPKEEFSGTYDAWSNSLYPDDKYEAEKDVESALRGDKDFNSEFRIVWNDGSIHYIDGRAIVLRDISGDPVRMLGVNWDITEIKKLEEELRKHSLIVTSMQDSIIVVDLEFKITHWNKGSEIMFGFSKNEALGKTTSIILKPEESEEFYATINKAIQNYGIWSGEVHFVRRDSTIGFRSSTIVPMLDAKGNKTGYLGINRDITVRKENEEKLKALTADLENQKKQLELLASTDSLTGLLNRRSFIERIKREIGRQQRSGKSFSVVISDIDKFKSFNDSYGHPFGDSVLIKVTNTLKDNIRSQDSIGRWGGEEFILLLPETSLEGAFLLSEKLRESLEASELWFEDKRITVTATFGISECKPEGDYLDSIRKADQALYEGKEAGRNCVMRESEN